MAIGFPLSQGPLVSVGRAPNTSIPYLIGPDAMPIMTPGNGCMQPRTAARGASSDPDVGNRSLVFMQDTHFWYVIAVSRDASGSPLGLCTMALYRVADGSWYSSTISDSNGNFTLPAPGQAFFQIVSTSQDGTRAGITLPNVVAT